MQSCKVLWLSDINLKLGWVGPPDSGILLEKNVSIRQKPLSLNQKAVVSLFFLLFLENFRGVTTF